MSSGLVAGMDVGGTKTRLVVQRDGAVIGDEIVLTETWRTWNVDDDAEGLVTLTKRVCGGIPQSFAVGAHASTLCVEFACAILTFASLIERNVTRKHSGAAEHNLATR